MQLHALSMMLLPGIFRLAHGRALTAIATTLFFLLIGNISSANTGAKTQQTSIEANTDLTRMQEIDPESCQSITPESPIKPIYQISTKPQLPTTAAAYSSLNLIDLLNEQQLADYLSTRSGAPPLQTRLQGLLATTATASDVFVTYELTGKITNSLKVTDVKISETRQALESPESQTGKIRLVVSDEAGIKLDTRRYDLQQIVMIQANKALETKLTTVRLLSNCVGANVFATNLDGRLFSFQKESMDFRLLVSTEKNATSVSVGYAGNVLFSSELSSK